MMVAPRRYAPMALAKACSSQSWTLIPAACAASITFALVSGVTADVATVHPWMGEGAGSEPVLAGSGSTWFVDGADAAGKAVPNELRIGAETARLVRARTVPAGWEGD